MSERGEGKMEPHDRNERSLKQVALDHNLSPVGFELLKNLALPHIYEDFYASLGDAEHAMEEDSDSDDGDEDLSKLASKFRASVAGVSMLPPWVRFTELEEDYEVLQALGEGTHGAVFRVRPKAGPAGVEFAAKMFRVEDVEIEVLTAEIEALADCQSEHVVQFRGVHILSQKVWLLMELCVGSILDIINDTGMTLTEQEIRAVCAQLLLGLHVIHGKKFIHRDIKAANLLVTQKGEVRIADFGILGRLRHRLKQRSKHVRRNSVIGTSYWMAPEILEEDESGYDEVADVWSVGITAIEMADGEPPRFNLHPSRAMFLISSSPAPTLDEDGDWTPAFHDFISKCLAKDPRERPSVNSLLRHPFVNREVSMMLGDLVPGNTLPHPCKTLRELLKLAHKNVAEEGPEPVSRLIEDDPIRYRRPSTIMYTQASARGGMSDEESSRAHDSLAFRESDDDDAYDDCRDQPLAHGGLPSLESVDPTESGEEEEGEVHVKTTHMARNTDGEEVFVSSHKITTAEALPQELENAEDEDLRDSVLDISIADLYTGYKTAESTELFGGVEESKSSYSPRDRSKSRPPPPKDPIVLSRTMGSDTWQVPPLPRMMSDESLAGRSKDDLPYTDPAGKDDQDASEDAATPSLASSTAKEIVEESIDYALSITGKKDEPSISAAKSHETLVWDADELDGNAVDSGPTPMAWKSEAKDCESDRDTVEECSNTNNMISTGPKKKRLPLSIDVTSHEEHNKSRTSSTEGLGVRWEADDDEMLSGERPETALHSAWVEGSADTPRDTSIATRTNRQSTGSRRSRSQRFSFFALFGFRSNRSSSIGEETPVSRRFGRLSGQRRSSVHRRSLTFFSFAFKSRSSEARASESRLSSTERFSATGSRPLESSTSNVTDTTVWTPTENVAVDSPTPKTKSHRRKGSISRMIEKLRGTRDASKELPRKQGSFRKVVKQAPKLPLSFVAAGIASEALREAECTIGVIVINRNLAHSLIAERIQNIREEPLMDKDEYENTPTRTDRSYTGNMSLTMERTARSKSTTRMAESTDLQIAVSSRGSMFSEKSVEEGDVPPPPSTAPPDAFSPPVKINVHSPYARKKSQFVMANPMANLRDRRQSMADFVAHDDLASVRSESPGPPSPPLYAKSQAERMSVFFKDVKSPNKKRRRRRSTGSATRSKTALKQQQESVRDMRRNLNRSAKLWHIWRRQSHPPHAVEG